MGKTGLICKKTGPAFRETDRRKRKEYPYKISYPSPRDQGTPGKRRSGSGKKDPFRKLLTKKKGYRNLIFLSL
jgi:hypothetical protein